MIPNLPTAAAWGYGLAGAAYAGFLLYLSHGLRGGVRGMALMLAVGLTAIWALIDLGFAVTHAAVLYNVGALTDVLRMGAWFAFLLLLIRRPTSQTNADETRRLAWLPPVAIALLVMSTAAQVAVTLRLPIFGDPLRFVMFTGIALNVFGLVLVEQLLRIFDEAHWNIKPLCLGLAGVFSFDLYLFADALLFTRVDADAWSVRGLVHALVVPLLVLSAVRNREWTLGIVLSRRVMFHSTALMASGIYLLFMAAAGYYIRYFGGSWGGALQVALIFAAFLTLASMAFSGSVRAKLRVIVSKHFFAYRYDYRDEWLRFTQALSARGGQRELGGDVIKGLADMVESPAGSLWLRELTGGQFVQAARWNMPADAVEEPASSDFMRFLSDSGWVLNLEEYRSSPERYHGLRVPQWLSEWPNAWLVIPLASASEMIGFVVLATARTRVDVDWEVRDLLKTAARQAATFLGQMQATEALLEARKFDAFNRMSAFVVHDLKNIVAQLSLMVKNADRHRDNPEFQKDMLMTIEHSVDRMKQLMMQLREGTTPIDVASAIDLVSIVDRIQRTKANQRATIELRLEAKVAAQGHEDRLERVIGHLVQNAIDATSQDGQVWITLAKRGGMAMVEVGDTGRGMTSEFVRERLFKPFQTTKATGMGIGAYESFQYVRELGGRVEVDSTPGVGTQVRLLLPSFGLSPSAERVREDAA